ncbi:hypothetical protein GCM10007940_35760 [Portibacter lacus]|uniref:Uncharacterized protein n=2 Tax=Portibacter lacus TaxID=1099794 RepID=A0AA37WHP8_9BACT|nr:hypothetical protein GCM10007940_35760 [Portibacter lacus]
MFFNSIKAQQVGINKIYPEHTLDVRSTNNVDPAGFNLSNQDKSKYVRLFSGSTTYPDPSIAWNPDYNFVFATYNDNTLAFTEYMRISSVGDVGIGVANPEAKLDILGGDWNLDAGNAGDFRIGNATYNFRIGIATGGGGAGITRMYANSNDLILGANDTPILKLKSNGELLAPLMTNNIIESGGNKSLITKEYADATYVLDEVKTKEIMIPAASFSTLGLNNYVIYEGIAYGSPLIAPVVLPVGSIITELSAYFYDSNNNNFSCTFNLKNINSNFISSFYTISTDNSTSGHKVITSTTNIQITSNFAYFLTVKDIDEGDVTGFNGLKGVKIKYIEN